jgi:hypothetical protein
MELYLLFNGDFAGFWGVGKLIELRFGTHNIWEGREVKINPDKKLSSIAFYSDGNYIYMIDNIYVTGSKDGTITKNTSADFLQKNSIRLCSVNDKQPIRLSLSPEMVVAFIGEDK